MLAEIWKLPGKAKQELRDRISPRTPPATPACQKEMASQVWDTACCANVSACDATVSGFVEIKNPQGRVLDFAFVVEVEWSDCRTTVLKRTYTDFQKLHVKLSGTLAAETKKRLPAVPGKKLFQRNTRELAERREVVLNTFVRKVIRLPPEVSRNPVLINFLESRKTDPRKAVTVGVDAEGEEAMMWDWMADMKPEEEEEEGGFSYCYDNEGETDPMDDINWRIHPADSGFAEGPGDTDSGTESAPASRSASHDGDLHKDSTTGPLVTTADGEVLTEEKLKAEVDIASMARRSCSYYNICYDEAMSLANGADDGDDV